MSDELHTESTIEGRPNSGLREGSISHAEVNASLRIHEKTIVFGQQNRLRAGRLMADDKLPRYHAGHDVVKFFYGAIRQLPESYVDALLHWGISVTMVKSPDLLVFHHCRAHQSFHVGYTRKTVYMPEMVLKEAHNKGYDYWAISETMIAETTPLMNYLMLLSFVRRARLHLHSHYTLGHHFVRSTMEELNQHLKCSEDPECEFNLFYNAYEEHLYSIRREDDSDPYAWVDGVFDEGLERKWARLKLFTTRDNLGYPSFYDIDRDIVHPAAFAAAERLGQPTQPEGVADLQHDLQDAARFGISAQIKGDRLMDQLVELGAPGIRGFAEIGWGEGEYWGGGYYPTVEFKEKLMRYSSSPEEPKYGSVALDFRQLLHVKALEDLQGLFNNCQHLSFRKKKSLGFRLLKLGGGHDVMQLMIERDALLSYTENDDELLSGLIEIIWDYYLRLDHESPDFSGFLLSEIIRKLDRHPRYHDVFLPQYTQLTGGRRLVVGEHAREIIDELAARVPEHPARFSYDPQRVRARWHVFTERRRLDGGNPDLLTLLAGVLLRLDRMDCYDELVAEVASLGERSVAACREIVESIDPKDAQRRTILQSAQRLLSGGMGDRTGVQSPSVNTISLLESFYAVIDRVAPDDRNQPLIEYMRDEGLDKRDILHMLRARKENISAPHGAVIRLLFSTE